MEALERVTASEPELAVEFLTPNALRSACGKADLLPELLGRGHDLPRDDETFAAVCAHDLASGSPVMVPLEAVLLDRTRRSRYWQSSDGLASGNNDQEAIFHALLERIERDAHALWQILPEARQLASAVASASFGSHIIDELASRIEQRGLSLRIFDNTSDTGVPTFAAFLAPRGFVDSASLRYVDVTFGCGSHPDAVRACIRAITEAAQSRLTYISGARDDVYPETYLRPLPKRIRRLFSAEPSRAPSRSKPYDIKHLLQKLQHLDLKRLYVVRMTRPDLPFSVVKVLAPELENPPGERRLQHGVRAISSTLTP
jgi:ribosomal protein S12 methylthiotransferase accessory factor